MINWQPNYMASPTPPHTLYMLPASSCLSEDVILTGDISLTPSPMGQQMVLFQGAGGRVDMLVIAGEGLVHIYQDSTQQSGWNVALLDSTATAAVVGGIDNDQTLHAVYLAGPNQMNHIWLNPGAAPPKWSPPQTFSACAALRVTTTPKNQLVVYGVTPSGELQVMSQVGSKTQGVWSVRTTNKNFQLSQSLEPTLVFVKEDKWILMTMTNTTTQGVLTFYGGTYTSNSVQQKGKTQNVTVASVSQVVGGFYQGHDDATFLYSGQAGDLNSATLKSPTQKPVFTQISQTGMPGITQWAARQQPNGLLDAFGVSKTNSLYATRQSIDYKQLGKARWEPCVPIETGVQAVYTCAPSPLSSPTVPDVRSYVSMGQNDALTYSAFDYASKAWRTMAIQAPAQKNYQLAQYRTSVTVVAQDGTPAAGAAVTISAPAVSFIRVGNSSYLLDPQTSVTCKTDGFGKLTWETPAWQLTTPAITLTLEGQASVTVRPDADVQNYLGGTGTLASFPKFSGDTLMKATVGGQPLIGLPQDKAQQAADAAASAIISVMGIDLSKTAPSPNAGFALDLSDPANAQFQTFASAQDLAAYQAAMPGGEDGPESAELKDWFSPNFYRGVATGAITVKHWSIAAQSAEVTLSIETASGVKAIKRKIETLEQKMSVVHSIFNALLVDERRAVNWLSQVFNWAEIWNTALAIQNAIHGVLTWARQKVGAGGGNEVITQLNAICNKLETALTTDWQKALGTTKGPVSFSAMVGKFAPPTTAGGVSTPNYGRQFQTQEGLKTLPDINLDVQNGWLMDKVLTQVNQGSISPYSLPTTTGDSVDSLFAVFKTSESELKTIFVNLAKTLFKDVKSAADFENIAVNAFIAAIEDLVNEGLSVFFKAVVELCHAADVVVTGFDTMIHAPISLPLVSGLYQDIQKAAKTGATQELTIVGLVALMLAIPVNSVYKALMGPDQQPFANGANAVAGNAAAANFGAPDAETPSHYIARNAAGAAVQAVWAALDTGLDCVVSPGLPLDNKWGAFAEQLIQAFGILFPLANAALTAPQPATTETAKWAELCYAGCYLPIILDMCTFMATKNLCRYSSDLTRAMMSAAGAVWLGMGIPWVVADYSAINLTVVLANPLPTVGAFLRMVSVNDATETMIPFYMASYIDLFEGMDAALASIANLYVWKEDQKSA